ncbi:vitelline membrane outer layer 1-like protein [Penaeus vannamei]|uniref:Vitelline membrane outer layer 1-like protein n=1 Tax=Penaeus vannamei TaxID=6689 RepID=A0A423U3F1_PENVA|nr:vitelline membrane outer layer 1-like protein [Penaeus vannamei]
MAHPFPPQECAPARWGITWWAFRATWWTRRATSGTISEWTTCAWSVTTATSWTRPLRRAQCPESGRLAEVRRVDGREVEAVHLKVNRGEIRDHGDWGSWARCSPGGTLCGLQTRVEHDDVLNDDAGLCDVVAFCCTI